ncbi:MAG: DEAD/DEAH box helicase family protein [Actinomycetota bacterium]
MSLRDIEFKPSYSSDSDDILNEFYIPALQESVLYRRLAGYYSSTSLAIAAKGILGLLKSGGSMQMVISAELNQQDMDAIRSATETPEQIFAQVIIDDLNNLKDLLVYEHIKALGWLLANNRLEIKVAVPRADGIFHPKIGVFNDRQDNIVTFSGSINESAMGWKGNDEFFKSFVSWKPEDSSRLHADIDEFNKYWNNTAKRSQIVDAPIALRNKIVSLAPSSSNAKDLEVLYKSLQEEEHIDLQKDEEKPPIKLRDYQKDAVLSWQNNKNIGIFEMATGTGKTRAALACMDSLIRKDKTQNLFIVVCPSNQLIVQWIDQVDELVAIDGPVIIADSTNPKWKDDVADRLVDFNQTRYRNILIVTTYSTFSSSRFHKMVQEASGESVFLIADEVHNLGAPKFKKGIDEYYKKRLGLSATPKRWFDDTGTSEIYDYFGGEVFSFSLGDAVTQINPETERTYLTPYRYFPSFIYLTDQETSEYLELSKTIARLQGIKSDSGDEQVTSIERLLFKRANIIKNAVNKLQALDEIIRNINPDLTGTLIYVSPQQIQEVMQMLGASSIRAQRFTMEKGTKKEKKYGGKSERSYLLENFSKGKFQVLVAMKCLDEGVDIAEARTAIFLSSSGNPREYIQRIGRVLRRCSGKESASIYDIIALPKKGQVPKEMKDIEEKMIRRELKRYIEIARTALNNGEAIAAISKIYEQYK